MKQIDGLRRAALSLPALSALMLALLISGCSSPPRMQQGPVPSAQLPPVEELPVLTPRMAAEAEALSKMAVMQDRLYRVAAPLLINNAELCKAQARNLLGFTAKNRYSYPGEYNEAAHIAFGMDDRLQVTGVLAGSGAAQAGLRRGDRLMTAGAKPLPSGAKRRASAVSVFFRYPAPGGPRLPGSALRGGWRASPGHGGAGPSCRRGGHG